MALSASLTAFSNFSLASWLAYEALTFAASASARAWAALTADAVVLLLLALPTADLLLVVITTTSKHSNAAFSL